MSEQMNGKKVALWIITSIVAACALVVILMVIFFKTYEPKKGTHQNVQSIEYVSRDGCITTTLTEV